MLCHLPGYTLSSMTFHACAVDGRKLGEFTEAEFRRKIASGDLSPQDYYWHEGMADWKPISGYRVVSKTQRISFAPPLRPTVKIKVQTESQSAKIQKAVGRILNRIGDSMKGRTKSKREK